MSEMIAKMVEALREAPETHLAIFGLALELTDEHGELDIDRAILRADEIKHADEEARLYATSVHEARRDLMKVPPAGTDTAVTLTEGYEDEEHWDDGDYDPDDYDLDEPEDED